MKRFIFSLLVCASLVFSGPGAILAAAREVPGEVPKTAPLQPLPFDTAPDVSHNVDNHGEAAPGAIVQPDSTAPENSQTVIAPSKTSQRTWYIFGIAAPLLFLAGWGFWRYAKKVTEEEA
jgi:hypothetical protein